jgi:hypothetical protein
MKRLLLPIIVLSFLFISCATMPTESEPTAEARFTPNKTFVSSTAITPNLSATDTPEPTATATETAVPAPEYSLVTNAENDAQMNEVTLAADIKTGKLANWILAQPQSKLPIASDPSKITYTVDHFNSDKTNILDSDTPDGSGTMRNSSFFALFKINPSEFGVQGKNDVYLDATIVEDKNGNTAVQFSLCGKNQIAYLAQNGYLTNPSTGAMSPRDSESSYNDSNWISGKPGGPDDARDLEDGKTVYGAQGSSPSQVLAFFNDVAANGFTQQNIQVFNTTVFLASPNVFLNN